MVVEACVPEAAGRVSQPGPSTLGCACPRPGSFPVPFSPRGKSGSKIPTFHPPHISGTWWAVGRLLFSQWCDGCPGSMAGWRPEPRSTCVRPQAAVTPSLTLSPRKACGSLRQGPGGQAAAPSPWPRMRSMSMLHAAPSLWPTASTCFLHNYVRGTWGTVLQEPQFGWGARRASLFPGFLCGPGARLGAFLRLRFPFVNCKDG